MSDKQTQTLEAVKLVDEQSNNCNFNLSSEEVIHLTKEIADVLDQKELYRVSVTMPGGFSITCKKYPAQAIQSQNTIQPVIIDTQTKQNKAEIANTPNYKEIKSDMIGTIYLAASPTDPPYITIGSHIKEGQTLFIIDAMKVMNHFKSPCSGIVKEILIQNEQVVEYGQVLVRVA